MEQYFKTYVCLGHVSQSFTQNYQHNLSIDKICNLQNLETILWLGKKCQSIPQTYQMQTENWILRQFS